MDKLTIRELNNSDFEKVINILKLNVPKYFAASEINDFQDYLNNEIEYYFVVEVNN